MTKYQVTKKECQKKIDELNDEQIIDKNMIGMYKVIALNSVGKNVKNPKDNSFCCKYCGDVVPVGMDYCTNCTNENPKNVPRDTINCVYIEYYDVVGKIESWATRNEAIGWARGDIGLNKVVGWVIETNDKFTLIGSHRADNPDNSDLDQWGQLTRIPTSIITKKVNL